MENGPEMVSQALHGSATVSRTDLHSAGLPWDYGYIEAFNNRLRRE